MKKNLFNNYVVDLLQSIRQNLSIYIINKKPICLHHLRVDIKKIRAAFSFTKYIYKKKYNLAKLKPIFNKAGKIREIQINIHLISLFPDPPERLITQLEMKEDILTQQFIKNGSQYFKQIRNFRKNVCLPELLPNKKTINKYFVKEKQKSNIKLEKNDREVVHRYRTKIKRLMYVYNAFPKRIQREIELNEAEINLQQERLGDWHDTYSAINFLSHEHFSLKTAELVLKLKEKEKGQFNALFKK